MKKLSDMGKDYIKTSLIGSLIGFLCPVEHANLLLAEWKNVPSQKAFYNCLQAD